MTPAAVARGMVAAVRVGAAGGAAGARQLDRGLGPLGGDAHVLERAAVLERQPRELLGERRARDEQLLAAAVADVALEHELAGGAAPLADRAGEGVSCWSSSSGTMRGSSSSEMALPPNVSSTSWRLWIRSLSAARSRAR